MPACCLKNTRTRGRSLKVYFRFQRMLYSCTVLDRGTREHWYFYGSRLIVELVGFRLGGCRCVPRLV